LKMWRMRTVPCFVPQLSEKFSSIPRKTLKLNRIDGAGRGGRTPTRLPSADFESAASASSAIPAGDVLLSLTRRDADGKPGGGPGSTSTKSTRSGKSLMALSVIEVGESKGRTRRTASSARPMERRNDRQAGRPARRTKQILRIPNVESLTRLRDRGYCGCP
jgi:hypothetical protein